MNADEIVRALKNDAKWVKKISWANALTPGSAEFLAVSERITEAADLIESLQAQLSASQRMEKAAVEDIYKMTDGGECDICKHYNPDKNTCAKPFVPYDDCFEWRGPQNSEKGENNVLR